MDIVRPETAWLFENVDGVKFSQLLDRSLNQAGASVYLVSELSGIDRPYLHRLRSGVKEHPSRGTVLRIGATLVRLGLDLIVVDELLAASGHLPIFVLQGIFPLSKEERQKIAKTKSKQNRNANKR